MQPGVTVVIIAQDCREAPTATGATALYEGRFNLRTERRYRGARAHLVNNPRMRLADGSVIWGIQCWWRPATREESRAHWRKIGVDFAGLVNGAGEGVG